MKASSKLSIAAVAVLAVAAALAVVASPAAAVTKLCQEEVNPCPGAKQYKTNQALGGSATNTQFVIEPVINMIKIKVVVLCTGSNLSGKTTADSGVPIKIEGLTFAGCTTGGNGCTVTAHELPWTGSIAIQVLPNGHLQQEVAFNIQCPTVPLKCRYGASAVVLAVNGGNPAAFTASSVTLNTLPIGAEEKNCPSAAKWTGSYSLTTPGAMYVTE